ncbi:MAG TPA: L,D-transpeptidase family protein, partial [Actinomycetota bacterium]|nr:L,D-transpeptidase family protein [Actinomycetota bacterium]
LPGASIAGVDVGGMDRDDAIAAVKEAVAPQLTREVTVAYEGKTWSVTPEELGARSDARAAVDAALAASEDVTFVEKARMRVLGEALEFERDVAVRYPRKGIRGFVAGIASSFDREARDASLDYSTGWVEIVDDRRGRKVRLAATVSALTDALESGTDRAELVVERVDPEVTTDAFRQVLLVHIGENKLYLYEDGEIVREWTVATGEPDYMTPTGLFHVTEKRYMPTWVNPAPDGWGASMPASIPPGPGNPLGVRAINWSAPAIRFHGTSALYSLGYNASHGCVRMSNADVIELYDIVEVGTPIVSIVYGPLRPLGSSIPAGPTAEQSADSTDDARAAETEATDA